MALANRKPHTFAHAGCTILAWIRAAGFETTGCNCYFVFCSVNNIMPVH